MLCRDGAGPQDAKSFFVPICPLYDLIICDTGLFMRPNPRRMKNARAVSIEPEEFTFDYRLRTLSRNHGRLVSLEPSMPYTENTEILGLSIRSERYLAIPSKYDIYVGATAV